MSEHSLAPTLLLSMPQLHDPNFAQTVVLLCQHSEEGAFGLVMNRPVTTTAKVMAHGTIDEASEHELEVWIGGPVEPDRSWILLPDDDSDDEAIRVCEGVFLSTSASVLQRIIDHDADDRTRLIAGYAGWGPGQLDAEIAAGAWVPVPLDEAILFDDDIDKKWENAFARSGLSMVGSMMRGGGEA